MSLKGCRKCDYLITSWKYYHDKNDAATAAAVAEEIANAAGDCNSEEKKKLYEDCYSAMLIITECCMKDKQFNAASLMVLCRFAILRECCDNSVSDLLCQLEGIGFCFVSLAKTMFGLGERDELMRFCVYIDELIEFMFDVCSLKNNKKNSMVQKNQYIFAVLSEYGAFCMTIKNQVKALTIFSQMITMIKTLYGRQAKELKILVECYYNIGTLYDFFKQPYQAINAMQDALSSCEKVINWKCQDEKNRYVSMCSDYLEYLKSKHT